MSKAGPLVPTSITQFFLGGVVLRDDVGKILEALYLNGASHLDVAPFLQGLASANGNGRLSHVETLALPPPNKTKSAKTERARAPKYPNSANEVIVKALSRRSKGLDYAGFTEVFTKLGRAASSTGANLSHASKAGLIKKSADGTYTLVSGYKEKLKTLGAHNNVNGAKAAKGARAKYGSVRPEVLKVLHAAFPQPMTPAEISRKVSVPHKIGAVNSALSFFVERKHVKYIGGKYAAAKAPAGE